MENIEIIQQESVELARELLPKLIAKQWFLGAAESLTGGLLSTVITDIPGASQVFKGAVISYQNSVKSNLLAVSSTRLRDYGAVDSVVVEQMSQGAIDTLGADVAVSVSGVAGPGSAEGKAPGTVWINVTNPNSSATMEFSFFGNRKEVRWQTVRQALRMLSDAIRD